jgi:hypothetical protein
MTGRRAPSFWAKGGYHERIRNGLCAERDKSCVGSIGHPLAQLPAAIRTDLWEIRAGRLCQPRHQSDEKSLVFEVLLNGTCGLTTKIERDRQIEGWKTCVFQSDQSGGFALWPFCGQSSHKLPLMATISCFLVRTLRVSKRKRTV